MKTNARPDWDDEAEREPLRAVLRGWRVPAPPAEIEDALRLAFRRRRARPRLAVWLSAAAAVALAAAWPLVAPHLGRKPAAPSPAASTGLPAPPADRLESAAPSAPPVAQVEPAQPTVALARSRGVASLRAARAQKAQPAVVVEPHQAELLAEFGRTALRGTHAAPGASMPPMPETQTPAFRAEWEEVAGAWPAVQVAVSESGR